MWCHVMSCESTYWPKGEAVLSISESPIAFSPAQEDGEEEEEEERERTCIIMYISADLPIVEAVLLT